MSKIKGAFNIFVRTPVRSVWSELLARLQTKKNLRLATRNFIQNQNNKDSIFVWIPKTAGTSLWNNLSAIGAQRYLTVEAIENRCIDSGINTFGHLSIPELIEKNLLSNEYFDNAWKFAIVRNPFDRAVSLFEYLKKCRDLPSTTTFSIFCRYLEENAFPPIGLYNHRGLNQVNTQASWIKDSDGQIFTNFIGKYENIGSDLKTVYQELGIEPKPLSRLNRTKRKPIISYYTSTELSIIRKAYAEDFDLFGYSDRSIQNLNG